MCAASTIWKRCGARRFRNRPRPDESIAPGQVYRPDRGDEYHPMKITVACVGRAGRAKHDAAQSLLEDYRARLPWPVTVKEVEDRKQGGSTAERKSREGAPNSTRLNSRH